MVGIRSICTDRTLGSEMRHHRRIAGESWPNQRDEASMS